jgi:spore coat protein U-like protein
MVRHPLPLQTADRSTATGSFRIRARKAAASRQARLRSLCAAVALACAATAVAAEMQTVVRVTSSIESSCSVTAAALDFGAYHGKQRDVTGGITVACTKGIPYHIGLDNGLHYSAPYRRLKHRTGADYLTYELYRDAARTARWGSDEASDVQMSGDGTVQHFNVYGRVPGGQTGPAGSYSNTTAVIVDF